MADNQTTVLIERLRSPDLMLQDEEIVIRPLCLEAAAELQRLHDEVLRLKDDVAWREGRDHE